MHPQAYLEASEVMLRDAQICTLKAAIYRERANFAEALFPEDRKVIRDRMKVLFTELEWLEEDKPTLNEVGKRHGQKDGHISGLFWHWRNSV